MTLESRIIALAQAIGADVKSLNAAIGGSSTPQVISQTKPVIAGPWFWWKQDADGNIINLTINDGL